MTGESESAKYSFNRRLRPNRRRLSLRLRRSTWGGFGVNFEPKDKTRRSEYERE